jgi:hypothetical protein
VGARRGRDVENWERAEVVMGDWDGTYGSLLSWFQLDALISVHLPFIAAPFFSNYPCASLLPRFCSLLLIFHSISRTSIMGRPSRPLRG